MKYQTLRDQSKILEQIAQQRDTPGQGFKNGSMATLPRSGKNPQSQWAFLREKVFKSGEDLILGLRSNLGVKKYSSSYCTL